MPVFRFGCLLLLLPGLLFGNSAAKKAETYLKDHNYTESIRLLGAIHPDSLNDAGKLLLAEAYFRNQQLEESRNLLEILIPDNLVTDSTISLADQQAMILLSKIAIKQRDRNTARQLIRQLDESGKVSSSSPVQIAYYLLKADFYINTNKDSSGYYYRKIQPLLTEDNPIISEYNYKIADYLAGIGEADSGMVYLDRGIEIQKKRFPKDTVGLLNLQLQKGYQLYCVYEYIDSEAYFREEIKPILFRDHSINQNVFNVLKTDYFRLLIITLRALGDDLECIRIGKQYLMVASEFLPDEHYRFGEVYREISKSYQSLGRMASYIDYNKRATDILDQYDFYRRGSLLLKIERNIIEGNFDKAIRLCDQYLSTTDYHDFTVTKTIYDKTYSLVQTGRYRAAMELSGKLLDTLKADGYGMDKLMPYYLPLLVSSKLYYEELPDSISSDKKKSIITDMNKQLSRIIKYLNGLKDITYDETATEILNLYAYDLNQQKKYDSAIYFAEKALVFNKLPGENDLHYVSGDQATESLWIIGDSQMGKYRQTNQNDDLKLAIDHFYAAYKQEKESNQTTGNIRDKIFVIADHYQNLQDQLIESLYLYQFVEEQDSLSEMIFEVFEQSKSQLLLNALKTSNIRKAGLLPDSLQLFEESLRQQQKYLKREVSAYAENSRSRRLRSFKNTLKTVDSRLDALYAAMKADHGYVTNDYNAEKVISLNKAKSSIREGQGILHYYYSIEANYLFLITPTSAKLTKLPSLEDSLLYKHRKSLDPVASSLSYDLTAKTFRSSSEQIYNLLLKPVEDDLLQLSKLIIIPDKKLHNVSFESLLYENADGSIDYSLLPYLIMKYTVSYSYSVTTLYNQYSGSFFTGNRLLGYAPSYEQSDLSKEEIVPLTWNDEELNRISSVIESEMMIDQAALKIHFIKNHDQYNIHHLAMHSFVNEADPLRSRLVFANQIGSPEEQYSLYADEIFDMKLTADLSVLSACNTNVGKIYSGEGPMSIAKSIIYAGCPSVVVTQWSVEDKVSSDLMYLFYENLDAGQDKAEALRNAKISYLAKSDFYGSSPALWNNFILIGDTEPLQDFNYRFLVIIVAFLLVSIIGMVYYRSKVKRN